MRSPMHAWPICPPQPQRRPCCPKSSIAARKPIAPDSSKLPQGLPAMRKIIEVSALKLPLSTGAARKISRCGSFGGQSQRARSSHASGARPGRAARLQPEEPVTSSDRLPNQIEVSVGTFVVLLTTTDLQTVAVADPQYRRCGGCQCGARCW